MSPSSDHSQPTTGYLLALANSFGGSLIILGSVSNIIVVQQARAMGIKISFRDFARLGIPVTLAALAILGVIMTLGAAWVLTLEFRPDESVKAKIELR